MIVPLVGGWNQWVHMDYDRNAKGLVNLSGGSPGYFETLRIPLAAGRDFTVSDRTGSPVVAIVNEAFVRRFFGARNPLGETFRVEGAPGQPWPSIAIVGVVKNTKYRRPPGRIRSRSCTLPHSSTPVPASSTRS